MQMLVIKDDGIFYRVRKEDVGCSIFTPRYFVEGDDLLFEVLQVLAEKGVVDGIQELKAQYQAEPAIIEADLRELADCFLENDIFHDLSRQIKLILDGETIRK